MKIAIVGAGVAGSYLLSMLSNEHDVVCFERMYEDVFDTVCAWATSKHGIRDFVKDCGLNFDDYILHEGQVMYVDTGSELIVIKLKGLCTFHKSNLIKEMLKGQHVFYGKNIKRDSLSDEYDLIIDSTGVYRQLLPKIEEDCLIPCLQYKVKFHNPPYDDFYIKPFTGLSGYLWYFPLGNGYWHVGAGDLNKKHDEELKRFINRHPCEIVKKMGKLVRLSPPSKCEPFFKDRVVGVGESIGVVYPLLGEGIIPSLQCSKLLLHNLYDFQSYRKKVLKKFKIYDSVYRMIHLKIPGGFKPLNHVFMLMRIFFYMKRREKRYGLRVKLADWLKVMKL